MFTNTHSSSHKFNSSFLESNGFHKTEAMSPPSSSFKQIQEDSDIKIAQHIMGHLGLSSELPFDMLTKDNKIMIGNRLELILGMVHLFH